MKIVPLGVERKAEESYLKAIKDSSFNSYKREINVDEDTVIWFGYTKPEWSGLGLNILEID